MTKNLALQLYTIRNYAQSLEDRLKAAAAAGYTNVELAGAGDLSASELSALLKTYDLTVCSSHIALDVLKNDTAAQIAFNKTIGNSNLVVPWINPEDRPSDAKGWLELGKVLADIASKVNAAGLESLKQFMQANGLIWSNDYLVT
jgi:sugar phosphate isomerase/epimerase